MRHISLLKRSPDGRHGRGETSREHATTSCSDAIVVHQPPPPILHAVSSTSLTFVWQPSVVVGPADACACLASHSVLKHRLEYQPVRQPRLPL